MSSSIRDTKCPECGGGALSEQFDNTFEIHITCTECGYDSDFEYDIDDIDEEFDEEFDPDDPDDYDEY